MEIFTWDQAKHLPELWIYPLATMSQTGRNNQLIYDFSWRCLNKKYQQAAPKKEMRFGRALYHLLDCILEAYPALGPTFLSKVDLADAYMRIWVRMYSAPAVDFLVTKEEDSDPQLVGFHFSI